MTGECHRFRLPFRVKAVLSIRSVSVFAIVVFILISDPAALVQAGAPETKEDAPAVRRDQPITVIHDPSRARRPGDRIRIAFYNIENYTDGERDGAERTPERVHAQTRDAARLISEIDADILALAEIENGTALARLNSALDEPFPFGWITRYGVEEDRREKLNHALLSRFPAIDLAELDYGPWRGRDRPPRGTLRAIFDLGENHRLAVYVVHLKSNYGQRALNRAKRRNGLLPVVNDARGLVAASASAPRPIRWEVLVIGDFNVDPDLPEFADDPSLEPLAGWADLWRWAGARRPTVPTRYGDPAREFPPATFDRAYAWADATNPPWRVSMPEVFPRGVQVRNSFALPGDEGHVSDHYPIWIDLLR